MKDDEYLEMLAEMILEVNNDSSKYYDALFHQGDVDKLKAIAARVRTLRHSGENLKLWAEQIGKESC